MGLIDMFKNLFSDGSAKPVTDKQGAYTGLGGGGTGTNLDALDPRVKMFAEGGMPTAFDPRSDFDKENAIGKQLADEFKKASDNFNAGGKDYTEEDINMLKQALDIQNAKIQKAYSRLKEEEKRLGNQEMMNKSFEEDANTKDNLMPPYDMPNKVNEDELKADGGVVNGQGGDKETIITIKTKPIIRNNLYR